MTKAKHSQDNVAADDDLDLCFLVDGDRRSVSAGEIELIQ